jgi:hypothetical protein
MFMGLRGRLAKAGSGPIDEDAFSLVAKWSELLGLVSFSGDPYVTEHWAHCDAGGDWTQDGAEHLLAWLQVDLDVPNSHADVRSGDPRRPVPIHSTAQVLHTILLRVGSVELAEVAVAIPLARVPPTQEARVAVGRDWLLAGAEPASERRVVVKLDVAPRPGGGYATDRLLTELEDRAGDVVRGVVVRPAEHRRSSRRESDDEPPPLWQLEDAGVEFECSVPEWNVMTGAWLLDLLLVAYSTHSVVGTATISARRVA